MTRIPPVHLPPKVKWVDEGDKYVGGFLGSPQYGQKNWDGVAERVQKRLRRWKRAQPHLSYRGRVLVIHNLVASFLWHRVICLQPLEDLLNGVQKQLLDFFWGGLTGYDQPLYAVHWSKMVRVWSTLGARSWLFGYAMLKNCYLNSNYQTISWLLTFCSKRWARIWPWMFSPHASMCSHIFSLWFLSESIECLAEPFSVPPARHRCNEDVRSRTFVPSSSLPQYPQKSRLLPTFYISGHDKSTAPPACFTFLVEICTGNSRPNRNSLEKRDWWRIERGHMDRVLTGISLDPGTWIIV